MVFSSFKTSYSPYLSWVLQGKQQCGDRRARLSVTHTNIAQTHFELALIHYFTAHEVFRCYPVGDIFTKVWLWPRPLLQNWHLLHQNAREKSLVLPRKIINIRFLCQNAAPGFCHTYSGVICGQPLMPCRGPRSFRDSFQHGSEQQRS